jgi:protein SCO1/2
MTTEDAEMTSAQRFIPLALVVSALLVVPGLAVAQHDHHHHHGAGVPGSGYTRVEANYAVPNVTLVDMDGKKVALRSELESGGPVVVNFIFTSCTAICPVMSVTFSQVQRVLSKDAERPRMVSISIDPEYDTPARLKEYAARHDASRDWHMLTGDKESILAVARAFGAWRGDKMNHTPSTYLRAGPSKPWLRLDGFASPAEIVREYRSLVGTRLSSLAR